MRRSEETSHRRRDAVREMTAETDGGGGRQMGEDEKWSTRERQKDEGGDKDGADGKMANERGSQADGTTEASLRATAAACGICDQ